MTLAFLPWTHGFAMLSRLRRFLTQTKSLLMDEENLNKHKALWVKENERTREGLESGLLTQEESALCAKLLNQIFGENVRLEQESINFECLKEALL